MLHRAAKLNRLSFGMRPTVVTTNWTIEQIGERMDERIASRLSEFMVIALVGGDRRGMRGRR